MLCLLRKNALQAIWNRSVLKYFQLSTHYCYPKTEHQTPNINIFQGSKITYYFGKNNKDFYFFEIKKKASLFSIGEERKQIGIYFVIYVNDCKTSNRICCLFWFQYLHRGILSAKGYLIGVDSESWIFDIIRNDVHDSAKSLKTLLSPVPLSVTFFHWKKKRFNICNKGLFYWIKRNSCMRFY